MSLPVWRHCAWFSGWVMVLSTGFSGCSADEEPRAHPSAATASASGSASAGTIQPDDASVVADAAAEAVSERMAVYDGIFAGALALIRVGEETRFVTRGYGDLAARAKMAPGGRFQIGSVTKPMVATVVMQLVESGRLRLSDTVDRWLPGLVPGGRRISIEQLLSHRSGLPEYYAYVDTHRSYEPRQLVRIAMTRGKRSPIGSYMYANTNYIVLGLIIEKVTGQPL